MSNYFGSLQNLVDNFSLDVWKGHLWNGLIATNNWPVIWDSLFKLNYGNDYTISEIQGKVTWKTGEVLRFRNFERTDAYYIVHGCSFQWIGILGNVICADRLRSTLRAYDPEVSKKARIVYG